MNDHANCGSNAGKTVTCDRCWRTFVCTPRDDFYCAAEGDHCCEACLMRRGSRDELRIAIQAFLTANR